MLFNSYQFILVFLPLTLLVWHWMARRLGGPGARAALIGASLVFYSTAGFCFLLLLIGSMVVNFFLGCWLGRESVPRKVRHGLLVTGIVANLAVLGWFKYANFFVANTNVWFGTHWELGKIVLPLGISFHTFQQLGYLVDSFRGLTKGYRLVDYSLYVSFFPQLVAGPIVHHAFVIPQYQNMGHRGVEVGPAAEGVTMFTLGLAKKVLVADAFGRNASAVFGAVARGDPVGSADAWLGLMAYTFQIYFDFSGYSDMAVGLGRFFGISLPYNFDSPYAATSLIDFWRRWHITLSNFIRDYLYFPLGGNRLGLPRTLVNLLFVMTVMGLWHGANWTFVVWGVVHGLGLVSNHLWRQIRPPERTSGHGWIGWLITFGFVMLGWVLFRAENFATAGRFYNALFSFSPGPGGPADIRSRYWIYFALLLFAVRLLPNTQQIVLEAARNRWMPRLLNAVRWQPTPGWAWALGLLFTACVLSLSNLSEFLYWQF